MSSERSVKDLSGLYTRNKWSGRVDLNHRPPGPEPGAITRLRYAPTACVSSNDALCAGLKNSIRHWAEPLGKRATLATCSSPTTTRKLPCTQKIAGEIALSGGNQLNRTLEFVTQREFHDARLRG
jgi:hypothetical protein